MLRPILVTFVIIVAVAAAWYGYTQFRFYSLGTGEDVSFDSADGVTLSGTLWTPGGPGPHPAAVILHGAGPESRDGPGYLAHARAVRNAGLAVLLYDKRGTGQSGGDFAASSYGAFIADARAAVAYLRARPDIDASRVGLVGASESGWFTPEIAAGGGVAFVVNKAGPPLSFIDTVAYETRNDLVADGLSLDEAARQMAAVRPVWKAIARVNGGAPGDADRADLAAALEGLRQAVPDAEAAFGGTFAAAAGENPVFAEKIAYDPGPWLDRLAVPTLYLLAENDPVVPAAESVAALDRLRELGLPVEVRVIPDVGHTFYHWTGAFTGLYPPGYLSGLTDWVAGAVAR